MTRNDILAYLHEKYPELKKSLLKQIIDSVFDSMVDALKNHERIEIRRFGVFDVIFRKARTTINPRTGQRIHIDGFDTVKFKPSKYIKKL